MINHEKTLIFEEEEKALEAGGCATGETGGTWGLGLFEFFFKLLFRL